jgi:hypothetical protein
MNRFTPFFLIVSVFSFGQSVETKQFTPAELKQDLNFLFEKLEAIHPALYHNTPKAKIDDARKALENELIEPMTRLAFARKAIPVVTLLKDGHTALSFPTEEFLNALKMGGKTFPLAVLIRDGKIFVTANFSADTSNFILAEILSINEQSSEDLLEKLRDYTSAELGFYRDIRIQRAFGRLLWYCFGWGDVFDLQLSQDGALINKKINGITEQEFAQVNKKRGDGRKTKPYSFYTANNTGVIDFRSMSEMETFDNFLDSVFTVIKEQNIHTLVIDVRNNGGGNSRMGDMLLQYISDKPYKQIERMEVKNSNETAKFNQGKIGTISRVDETPLKKPKKSGNKFTGKTYLLTSHLTFSSANMLAIAFKCFDMGTIVGEETGGVYAAFGDVVSLKLPNTQLPAGCSFKKFIHPCDDGAIHGVKPDVEIVPTLADIQNRKDPAMDYVLQQAKKNN